MQPLISIIMPVYKVAGYLEQAVRSIMNQTGGNWELILVDDASPDESGMICDRMAQKDARIRVIHLQVNVGLSAARNAGMGQAKGRYIMFIDSDDWLENDLLEILETSVCNSDAPQLIVWGVTEEHFGENGKIISERKIVCPEEMLNGQQEVRRAALRLEEKTLLGYAWNKLYDAELLKKTGAAFEKIALIEDILFNLQVLPQVERMLVLSMPSYHYARRTEGSLTHRHLPAYYELSMRRVSDMLRMYTDWGLENEAAQTLAPIYVRYALSALQRNCAPESGMTPADRRRFTGEMLNSELFRALQKHMGGGGGLGALIGRMFQRRNPALCLVAGRVVYLVNTRMKTLFVHLNRRGGNVK